MKKQIILLLIIVIGVCLICGCVSLSQPVPQISDDDLYLQTLNDFSLSSNNAQQQSSTQFSSEQMAGAEFKIKATSFINRVTPLKVSSKFEYSKTSFLQALNEEKALGDYMMSMSQGGKSNQMMKNTNSAEELAKYSEFKQHELNFVLFLIKSYDSNVCSAAVDKYTNITVICKSTKR